MPKLVLDLSDTDYADVLRILTVREQAVTHDLPMQTNGQLFASVCREWESPPEVMATPACPNCGGDTIHAGEKKYRCVTCQEVLDASNFVPVRMNIHPQAFAQWQEMRKDIRASDIAQAVQVAADVYYGIVKIDQRGGPITVQERQWPKPRRLNLYPHDPKRAERRQ